MKKICLFTIITMVFYTVYGGFQVADEQNAADIEIDTVYFMKMFDDKGIEIGKGIMADPWILKDNTAYQMRIKLKNTSEKDYNGEIAAVLLYGGSEYWVKRWKIAMPAQKDGIYYFDFTATDLKPFSTQLMYGMRINVLVPTEEEQWLHITGYKNPVVFIGAENYKKWKESNDKRFNNMKKRAERF